MKELERLRDDCLVSIMEALRGHRVGAGGTLADNQQRLRRLREG